MQEQYFCIQSQDRNFMHLHSTLHTLLGFTKALEREDTERAARFFQPMLPLEPVFTFAPELHQDLDGSDTHQGLLVLWEKLGGGKI